MLAYWGKACRLLGCGGRLALLAAGVSLSGCDVAQALWAKFQPSTESSVVIQSTTAALLPSAPAAEPSPDRGDEAPSPARAPAPELCKIVEREAARANQELPRKLDEETWADPLVVNGCTVEMRYRLTELDRAEVVPSALAAMERGVVATLCIDPPTRGVLEGGGSFRSIYRDRNSEPFADFTVSLSDCSE
jgi:hypothetical protein